LADFDENNPIAFLSSPRSLQACKMEGVLPSELVYKPIEAFQERQLSPRLVKLRYDFFEAKRRDLLAAARRARDAMVAEERKDHSSQSLDIITKDAGVLKSAIVAMNSDGLKQERNKLLKAQANEKKWLQNALQIELNQLRTLEANNQQLSDNANKDEEKIREKARQVKEMNDMRAAEEERKQMELEARQKLEKQIAKEEFAKHLEALTRKAAAEAESQKRAYERQFLNAERKRQAELEKEQKRQQEHEEQEARKEEMRAQDLRRREVLEQQKCEYQQQMAEKKAHKDDRIMQSIQANMEMEQKKREDFEEKQRQEALREERLMHANAMDQEESAKKAFQTMMKRKMIAEEASRKQEERRMCTLGQQEETEWRLLEHGQKKERYLDFKRELDGLRNKNKEINVERQRRREEATREAVAEQVRKKDEKINIMNQERARLRDLRRSAQAQAYKARELVKSEIMRQRISSKFNSKIVEQKLGGLLSNDLFNEKALVSSASAPVLKSILQATMHQQSVEAC